jgi:hypothetical protein
VLIAGSQLTLGSAIIRTSIVSIGIGTRGLGLGAVEDGAVTLMGQKKGYAVGRNMQKTECLTACMQKRYFSRDLVL